MFYGKWYLFKTSTLCSLSWSLFWTYSTQPQRGKHLSGFIGPKLLKWIKCPFQLLPHRHRHYKRLSLFYRFTKVNLIPNQLTLEIQQKRKERLSS